MKGPLKVIGGVFMAITVGVVLCDVCRRFLPPLPSILVGLLTSSISIWSWLTLTRAGNGS